MGKLDRDQSRVMQLKTDLQHREEALTQQSTGVRKRPNNGKGGGSKLQGGIYSRQQEQSEQKRTNHGMARRGEESRTPLP